MYSRVYEVKISNCEKQTVFYCDENSTIFEAAKLNGMEFDYEYDSAATSQSMASLVSGVIDNSKQSYLDKKQINNGYILLTEAYPKSDCEIIIEKQSLKPENRLKSGFPSGTISGSEFVSFTEDYSSNRIGQIICTVSNATWVMALIGVFTNYPTTAAPRRYGARLFVGCIEYCEYNAGLVHNNKVNWQFEFKTYTAAAVHYRFCPAPYSIK